MVAAGTRWALLFFIIIPLLSFMVGSEKIIIRGASKVTEFIHGDGDGDGKRWAVLVAGSRGYDNYRHQADVCHAYQILKKGGLKDENIVVFMYDDIAFDVNNPRPGILINKPNGNDVYNGVPKDYTGDNCTVDNLFAVILGNKTALTGGSGKVVDSAPNDHIFIYYSDHGSAGVVGMPFGDDLYANDLIDVLKKKHHSKTYKSMVIYVEACESGSMFEGLLPSNLSIYAVTASNAVENSWGTYCPGHYPYPPPDYDTCLGDLFSISWMEDSDLHDLRKETLKKQYQVVRRRTAVDNFDRSHVMQYGDKKLSQNPVFVYMGTNPDNQNFTLTPQYYTSSSFSWSVVNQRDASLLHFWLKYHKAPRGSTEKAEAGKKLRDIISHTRHVDRSINQITKILFGDKKASQILTLIRPSSQPLVDDWSCLKMLVKAYEKRCGQLSWYGKKYTRAIANMCNAGVRVEQMIEASTQACMLYG
ncbi:vacuolar-processing enzyme [Manihot esculenta]|uniref:Legumain prodomain domain-containing protein n=1 Tax=Manihot esculenta TaxID=3983 RepID=A0A2C9VTE3_MANES|nr:vacuolar-processing enzyme [Manihot esculenta]OAY48710.1 hypothetical protein MANES_06G178900v8 [Manihot esculenta]